MDWKYLAGFFDGEGTITICRFHSKKRNRVWLEPHVAVSNNCKKIMDEIGDFLDENVYEDSRPTKSSYRVSVRSMKRIVWFLENIQEYLKIKDEQAGIVIEYCKSRLSKLKVGERKKSVPYTDREKQIRIEVLTLNRRYWTKPPVVE